MIITIQQVRAVLTGMAIGIVGSIAVNHAQVGRCVSDMFHAMAGKDESGFICVEHKKKWRCEDLPEVSK